jgi:predicted dithiol-disulfide oxidoreductase (DUF899 family)
MNRQELDRQLLSTRPATFANNLPKLTFSEDFDVGEHFGINLFFRDGEQIYRSCYTSSSAAEELCNIWGLLDITPFGRQEVWQDASEGVPQDRTGSWVRRRDEYTAEELAGGRS